MCVEDGTMPGMITGGGCGVDDNGDEWMMVVVVIVMGHGTLRDLNRRCAGVQTYMCHGGSSIIECSLELWTPGNVRCGCGIDMCCVVSLRGARTSQCRPRALLDVQMQNVMRPEPRCRSSQSRRARRQRHAPVLSPVPQRRIGAAHPRAFWKLVR
jgi:hypothetical protein